MTSTSQRIRALSTAQFEQLRTKNDDEFGQGYPLWQELVKQSNHIRNSGRDIIANDQFRVLLLDAKTKYQVDGTPLAESTPEYDVYRSLIDEFNGSPSRRRATPAPQPAVTTRTETAAPAPVARELAEETHTPAPAPAPVASPTPDVTVHRAPDPAPQPNPVVERDDTQAPAWFTSWNERELRPTLTNAVQDHKILHGEEGKDGLITRVENLEQFCFGDADQDEQKGSILDRFKPDSPRHERERKSGSRWDLGRLVRPHTHQH